MSKAILSRLSARGYDDLGQASLSIIPLLGGSESMPADWSGRTGLSRKVLRRAINLLIDRGYVEQVSDPDRIRAPHLRLTSRGIALGKACREVDIELQTLAAAALGPDGVKRLRRQLDGLRASLSAQASDGGTDADCAKKNIRDGAGWPARDHPIKRQASATACDTGHDREVPIQFGLSRHG